MATKDVAKDVLYPTHDDMAIIALAIAIPANLDSSLITKITNRLRVNNVLSFLTALIKWFFFEWARAPMFFLFGKGHHYHYIGYLNEYIGKSLYKMGSNLEVISRSKRPFG